MLLEDDFPKEVTNLHHYDENDVRNWCRIVDRGGLSHSNENFHDYMYRVEIIIKNHLYNDKSKTLPFDHIKLKTLYLQSIELNINGRLAGKMLKCLHSLLKTLNII
jgi:hypothetical protein